MLLLLLLFHVHAWAFPALFKEVPEQIVVSAMIHKFVQQALSLLCLHQSNALKTIIPLAKTLYHDDAL